MPHRPCLRLLLVLLGPSLLCPLPAVADLGALLQERLASQVFVEYYVQRELDRRPVKAAGLVVDDAGLIVLEAGAVPYEVPPDRLKDFKVYRLNERPEGYTAEYLGPDNRHRWNYVRVGAEGRAGLVPVQRWGQAPVRLTQPVWGLGIAGKEADYEPYFFQAYVSLRRQNFLWAAFTTGPVSIPGGAVYDLEGRLVGWSQGIFTERRILTVGNDTFGALLRTEGESNFFIEAADFLAHVGHPPSQVMGDATPWLGFERLGPVPKDAADYLKLESQGAMVINQVAEDSPAAQAGLKDGDILVGFGGAPLPRRRPDDALRNWFILEVLGRKPGEVLALEVIRGETRVPVSLTLGVQPKTERAAARTYFESLGLGVRELVQDDALERRVPWKQARGVFVSFVRPNGAPEQAGLRQGDWVEEIDGRAVADYAQAVGLLEAIAASDREEYVLLVGRGTETSVLRVKRK